MNPTTEVCTKLCQSQNHHSVTDKLAVIANVKHVESQAHVSHVIICGWLREEEKLHDFVDMVDSTDQMKRKTPDLPKPTTWITAPNNNP